MEIPALCHVERKGHRWWCLPHWSALADRSCCGWVDRSGRAEKRSKCWGTRPSNTHTHPEVTSFLYTLHRLNTVIHHFEASLNTTVASSTWHDASTTYKRERYSAHRSHPRLALYSAQNQRLKKYHIHSLEEMNWWKESWAACQKTRMPLCIHC